MNNFYGYAMSKFAPASALKWTDPKDFDLNKSIRNSSKEYVLDVDLNYAKVLRELLNDYPLDSDKIKIQKEMLSNH